MDETRYIDETRSGHRNANRNPQSSNFTPLFKWAIKWAIWKETCDDHTGFQFAFRWPFRVSSIYRVYLLENGLFLNFKYRFCKTLTHASWFSYQTQCIAKKKSRVISRFLDSHRVLKKRTTKNKIDYEIWKSAVQKAKRFCVMLYDRENAIATPPKSTKSSRETQIPRYKFKSNQNFILSLYREIPRI